MLLTTALLTFTPALQGFGLPDLPTSPRSTGHFQCRRVDTLDQACVLGTASTNVFDFMLMSGDNHVEGPVTSTSESLATLSLASTSAVGSSQASSKLLATAINITPRDTVAYVPQVTANLFGRLSTLNPDFSATIDASWELLELSAVGDYRILPRADFPSGFATLSYKLYVYCIGQDTGDTFDPAGTTDIGLTASGSTVNLSHLGLGAGWHLQAMLQRSTASSPGEAPEVLDVLIPEDFNMAWIGSQAVPIGPDGGGTHPLSFNVSQANAGIMMPVNQMDAAERTIGGSASFHVRRP